MTMFVIGIIVAVFLAGLIVGAYGHKYLATKLTTAGITPPPKLP